ncbi:unnamed protein product, partial [marine sediment metagenome]
YAHSTKLQRYQLELMSYTKGIAKPQLLSKYCGDNVITNLYDNRNDPNYGMTQACPQASQPTQLMSEAKQHFVKTQQALAAAWQAQGKQQRQTELVENETEVNLGGDKLSNRQDWLHLNASGQLDSLNNLMAVKTDKLSPADQANFAVSLLAVADGNRRFAYNRLFSDQPAIAKLLNQSANDVASIYDANNNQQKALQANNLLPLIGTPTHLGMLTQVCIWSWVTWGLLWLSRRKHWLEVLPIAITVWGLVIAGVSHTVILPMMVGGVLFCVGVLLS